MSAMYLKGLLLSLALVSSIGMQNLFVFNNAINQPLKRAWPVTIMVWFADTALTLAAFFGMGAIISSHEMFKLIIMFLGGLLVIWIGFGILRSAASFKLESSNTPLPMKKSLVNAWVVTWANPQAIIDTSLMFGAMRGSLADTEVTPFITGVVSATAIWFFGITLILGLLKERLPQKFLMWVNIVSGVIVMVYGAYLLYQAVMMVI
ncbi:LysE/ArgO family amino acid transporter [Levilactobacillus yiduensis]|uniref:LysE/ArgO family amino acid transporter n=1 Tax=Levilactobacillus yiduensis TaxID=2953880 RepID=UPI000EF2C538|nr:LysE family transporter [Levilactobacillus yiduensis]AYM01579.1 amino acid transporter [Levilactobacillus brevis]